MATKQDAETAMRLVQQYVASDYVHGIDTVEFATFVRWLSQQAGEELDFSAALAFVEQHRPS